MKKVILTSVISCLFSVSAFAAPTDGSVDVTSATIKWQADIPVIVPGQWITFTGANGASNVDSGLLDIKADGSFTSTPVNLEVHYYDNKSGQIGGGVSVGGEAEGADKIKVASMTYTVESPTFMSEKGVDMSNVASIIKMNGQKVSTGVQVDAPDADNWKTEWVISNKMGSVVPAVVAGDTVIANTVVRADVAFAASSIGEGSL